jgi:hypothetical protein
VHKSTAHGQSRDEALKLLGVTRDELANTLEASYGVIIKEANEWRPLADHVVGLVILALEKERTHELEGPAQ